MSVAAELRRGWQKLRLVSLWRRAIDAKPLDGFVVGLGERAVLLQIVSNTIDLDGYSALRLADVDAVEPPPRADFYHRALKLRGQRAKEPKGIFVDTFATLLETANLRLSAGDDSSRSCGSEICHIGQVRELTARTLLLDEIDPSANWEGETRYPIAEITRIDFGGRYEEALALVANARERR